MKKKERLLQGLKLLRKTMRGCPKESFHGLCQILDEIEFENHISYDLELEIKQIIKKELEKNDGYGYIWDGERTLKANKYAARRMGYGLYYWKMGVKSPRDKFLTKEINERKS